MSEAKKDALTLIIAAKDVCEKTPWKSRQDQRAANKIYTILCAAEKALEIVKQEETPND